MNATVAAMTVMFEKRISPPIMSNDPVDKLLDCAAPCTATPDPVRPLLLDIPV